MRRALALVVVAAPTLIAAARPASAQPPPAYTTSAFVYGFHGILLGAAAGLGAGYLIGRAGGWHSGDWATLGYGLGIGALAGGGLGLGLGISDMASQTPGRGYFILRDGGYGLGFGAVAGAIGGALAASAGTHRAETVLFGSAVGGLAGGLLGLGLGLVEGAPHGRVALSLASATACDAADRPVWMPALIGRY
jgi:hypothetical protein